MARINFPSNKSNGTEFTANGKTFQYDGKRWRRKNTQQERIDTAQAAAQAAAIAAAEQKAADEAAQAQAVAIAEAQAKADAAKAAAIAEAQAKATAAKNAAIAAASAEAATKFDKTGGTITGNVLIDAENLALKSPSPTMSFIDEDGTNDNFHIHVNSNNFYILPDRTDNSFTVDTGWEGPYAMQLEADTNKAYLFDELAWTGGTAPNTVVQCITKYVTAENSYTAPANGGNTIMSIMDMSITPKYSNSMILVQWEIQGEGNHNAGFRIYKNGAAAPHGRQTSSSYAFYASDLYDGNDASTPRRTSITYWDTPGSTATVKYQVAVGSSNTTSYTYRCNRTFSSGGAASYETGISTIVIWEIAQ